MRPKKRMPRPDRRVVLCNKILVPAGCRRHWGFPLTKPDDQDDANLAIPWKVGGEHHIHQSPLKTAAVIYFSARSIVIVALIGLKRSRYHSHANGAVYAQDTNVEWASQS